MAACLIANTTAADAQDCNAGMQVPPPETAAEKWSGIARVIVNGGSGSFRCAYQIEEAKGQCRVTVKDELVTFANESLKGFYGNSACLQTISIQWPSGKRSKFAWGDSLELGLGLCAGCGGVAGN